MRKAGEAAGKKASHSLLVGMNVSTVTLEISMENPQKKNLKNKTKTTKLYDSAISFLNMCQDSTTKFIDTYSVTFIAYRSY